MQLPGGKVAVVVRSESGTSRPDFEAARARLVSLLSSGRPREADLLRPLGYVLPTVITSADPSREVVVERRIGDVGVDLAFGLREKSTWGAVEVKNPTSGGFALVDGIDQLRKVVEVASKTRREEFHVEELHLIGGRREKKSEAFNERMQKEASRAGVRFSVHSWDDVLDSLVVPPEEEEFGEYRIHLEVLIEASHKLLKELVRRPEILNQIDDRRFEEMVATLLSDLGFDDVKLTPPRKDEGRDIEITHRNRKTGNTEVYLVECKHWISGNKVTTRWAVSLKGIVKNKNAAGGILLATGGFGPRLLEQEAQFRSDGVWLKDRENWGEWVKAWERTYGQWLMQPIDPLSIIV
jgi:hypothetical protein